MEVEIDAGRQKLMKIDLLKILMKVETDKKQKMMTDEIDEASQN